MYMPSPPPPPPLLLLFLVFAVVFSHVQASISHSVGPSVGRFIGPSVTLLTSIGVEFLGKSGEIVFNAVAVAVALISFMQFYVFSLKNPFLQLNIFATIRQFLKPKYSTKSNLSILY